MPTLLVAGAAEVDAGKTTFSTGLVAALRARGREPVAFDPRASNSYWYGYDDLRVALDGGRLYGKDARRLAAVSRPTDESIEPESVNALHRLWGETPGRRGMLGREDQTFLVDRLTTAEGDEFVVNGAAEEEGLVPAEVRRSLPLDGARRVRSVDELDAVTRERYRPAFDRLGERIAARETAVVESYSDVALPLSTLAPDAVAVVAPGTVRLYDGDRYTRAREAAGRGGHGPGGELEQRTGPVERVLEPSAVVDLPPLGSDARSTPATVAEAYADAYDALLAAAGNG